MNDVAVNEMVVRVCLATGWTLEYVRNLPVEELQQFAQEAAYQQACTRYREASLHAMIAAAVINSRGGRVKTSEIIGDPPKRTWIEKESIWEVARRAGIRVPAHGI